MGDDDKHDDNNNSANGPEEASAPRRPSKKSSSRRKPSAAATGGGGWLTTGSLYQRGALAAVAVLALVGFLYMCRSYLVTTAAVPADEQQQGSVRWADEEGGQLEQVVEIENLRAAKMALGAELEDVFMRAKFLQGKAAALGPQIEAAKQGAVEIAGDGSDGYDADMTAMESETNFETAFLGKDELDKKRETVANSAKQLTALKGQVEQEIAKLNHRFEALGGEYKRRYNTAYVPMAVVNQAQQQQQAKMQAQQRAQAQHAAAQQAQQAPGAADQQQHMAAAIAAQA